MITTAGANRFDGIEIGDTLPDGMVLNAGDKGGLDIADNTIIDGRHVFPRISLTSNRGIDRNLRVDKFGATKDTSIIKVTLANKGAMSLLGQSVETAENVLPPLLTDADGGQYEAIGFIYDDGTNVTIRFTPGEPLRGLVDLPSALSRSKRDQTAILLFRVTKGESILGFGLSSKVLAKFEPPLKVPK